VIATVLVNRMVLAGSLCLSDYRTEPVGNDELTCLLLADWLACPLYIYISSLLCGLQVILSGHNQQVRRRETTRARRLDLPPAMERRPSPSTPLLAVVLLLLAPLLLARELGADACTCILKSSSLHANLDAFPFDY
jgi:hypothetical protein